MAYVELSDPRELQEEALLELCRERLPEAAIPASIAALPALPRLAAGKLDRSQLPPPPWAHSADAGRPAKQRTSGFSSAGSARGSWESHVLRAFAATLALPGLEPTDDFWISGGDSLQAAQVAGSLGCSPNLLTAFPTARQLARHLSGQITASSSLAGALAPPTRASLPALVLPAGGQPPAAEPQDRPAKHARLSERGEAGALAGRGGIVLTHCGGIQHCGPPSSSEQPVCFTEVQL